MFGVDYAWGRPSTGALKAAGVEFVCRYLSHDATGKNLDRAEADTLSSAGIWLAVVWESTASRALDGYAAGAQDARDAQAQAQACGMPADRPIYFAVDFDATGQEAAITAYFDGAASMLGKDRIGVYGGLAAIRAVLGGGHCAWGWQTYAWSGGQWDGQAHLQQYSNDHTIDGVGLDYDRSLTADFGQWRVGVTPGTTPTPQEDDMPQGQLAQGNDAVTPICLPKGKYGSIAFTADNGLQGLPAAALRVAFDHGAGVWHIENISVDGNKAQTVVPFYDPANVCGISVQRSDSGNVAVAWAIS